MSAETILGLIGLAGGTISGFMLGKTERSVRLSGFVLLLLSLVGFAYFSEREAASDEQKHTNMTDSVKELLRSLDEQDEALSDFRLCMNKRIDELNVHDSIVACQVSTQQQ